MEYTKGKCYVEIGKGECRFAKDTLALEELGVVTKEDIFFFTCVPSGGGIYYAVNEPVLIGPQDIYEFDNAVEAGYFLCKAKQAFLSGLNHLSIEEMGIPDIPYRVVR